MDFDANKVVVPEAMDRANQFSAEIESRTLEIDELEKGVAERQAQIETHKMHIAACEAAMMPLRKVLDQQPQQSISDTPPLARRY